MNPPHLGRVLPVCLLALATMAWAATAMAGQAPGSVGPKGAQRVWLRAPGTEELATEVVGRGLVEAPVTAALSPAGEVAWEVVRDETDELGLRHVFYRQVLLPAPAVARLLEGVNAIPVVGSEVSVHWADGAIYLVYGYQYPPVDLLNRPAIGSARAAYEQAQLELQRREGFEVAPWMLLRSERTDGYVAFARLAARPEESGGVRLVWQVPTEDVGGRPYLAELDAASGAVTDLQPQFSSAVCTPSSNTQVSAVGKPQAQQGNPPYPPDRALWATVAADRGSPWTHEAHKTKVSSQTPEILVYMKTNGGETDYNCPTESGHGIMPLKTEAGSPTYDDFTSPRAIPGKSAGDAVYATQLAMQRLKSSFGRCGVMNNCNVAAELDIHYQLTSADVDTAYFWYSGSDHGVRVTPKSARTYTASAALDVIAHEWGHGVVYSGPGWTIAGVQGQLNEGFADVFGFSVEWLTQPAGSGVEKAEWKFFEDAPGPAIPANCDPGSYNRRVDIDDGAGCYKYHRDDEPYSLPLGRYAFGTMLPTVLRLMSEGGQNPLVASGRCNPATMPGCDTLVSGVGITKASKILMRTLTAYAVNGTQWEDLADLAMQSAWDLYKRCSLGLCPDRIYSADAEQYAAADAFTAIGYPPTQDPQECYCPPTP